MKYSGIKKFGEIDNRPSVPPRGKMRFAALVSLLLIASFALVLLSGCAGRKENDRFSVVCTNFPSYDFARELTRDTDAEVILLLSPGAETHSYEPTPQDIIKVQECDVFVCNGGESESWLDGVLSAVSSDSDMTVVKMISCVTALEEEPLLGIDDGDEHGNGHEDGDEHKDADGGHGDVEYDEHVWTSPKNAELISAAIEKALAEKDPENAGQYASNLGAYIEKLEKLDSDFRAAVDGGVRKTLVFGDRYPFLYFAKEYGLTCYAAFPGCSAETEPLPSTVAFLIDEVKRDNIPVVLHLEMSNTGVADTICESTGAETMLFHSCHNVSKDEFSAEVTYLSLMENNLEVLKKALS